MDFEKHILSNGLRVIVHPDMTTPMVAVNILYDVGARDEDPRRTGFAHLFEHLMFEGSLHVPDYDHKLQMAGGENNAFTSNDLTNYYLTLPAQNLEVGLWLESDRMMGLAFSEEKLRLQQNVVTEEFRQSYLNQPYGDVWLLLRELSYRMHPYRWPTIGLSVEHVQQASLQEVKDFFNRHYHPGNAILTIAGRVDTQETLGLVEKWFSAIPGQTRQERNLPAEPAQEDIRRLHVERDVPQHHINMAFHMCGRMDPDFHAVDLITDVLAGGESARLIQNLVHERKMFSEANAYVTGSIDPGQVVVTGKLLPGVDPAMAEEAMWAALRRLASEPLNGKELQKVKHKVEAAHVFAESNVLAKAMNLSYYELLGSADLVNQQMDCYEKVSAEDIRRLADFIFVEKNASILHYAPATQSGKNS